MLKRTCLSLYKICWLGLPAGANLVIRALQFQRERCFAPAAGGVWLHSKEIF